MNVAAARFDIPRYGRRYHRLSFCLRAKASAFEVTPVHETIRADELLRSLSLVHSLDNPRYENKDRTRIANQLTQVAVAARHSCTLIPAITHWHSDKLPIHCQQSLRCWKRDWKCRYG